MSESASINRSAVQTTRRRPQVMVSCDSQLGQVDCKTANGLVRHGERCEIELGHPAQDALTRRAKRLADMMFTAFPELQPISILVR